MKPNKPPNCSYPYCRNNKGDRPGTCIAATSLENQALGGGYGADDMGGGPYMNQTRWQRIYDTINSNASKHLCFLVHTLPELYQKLTKGKRSRGEFK